MHDLHIHCVTKGLQGSVWTLRFEDSGSLTLYDPQSLVVCRISPQDAQRAIRLPSFSQSIKYLGIVLPDGAMLEFKAEPELMRLIKAFVDRSLVNAGGPAAIAAMRRSGYLELFGGIGLAILGIVVTVVGYMAASTQGGRYYVTWGLVLWGFVMACRGGSKLARAGRLAPEAVPGFAVMPASPTPSDKGR